MRGPHKDQPTLTLQLAHRLTAVERSGLFAHGGPSNENFFAYFGQADASSRGRTTIRATLAGPPFYDPINGG
jgi:hypothetical protein